MWFCNILHEKASHSQEIVLFKFIKLRVTMHDFLSIFNDMPPLGKGGAKEEEIQAGFIPFSGP